MKFVYIDKTEFEADIITDILGSENINFKTKVNYKHLPMFFGIGQLELFDIKFNTDYQKYLFVDKLIQNKLNKYKKLEKCFDLPAYDKFEIVEKPILLYKGENTNFEMYHKALDNLEKKLKEELTLAFDNPKKPKETLLLKIIKWFKRGEKI